MYKVLLLGSGTYYNGFKNIVKILKSKSVKYFISNSAEDIEKYKPDVVFSFSYKKIIKEKFLKLPLKGVVVFHSSDLPLGRGWAPLYYAIVNNLKKHTITMFFANSFVDAGDIIAKATCDIHSMETINTLRKKDDIMTEVLFKKYIDIVLKENFIGTPQKGTPIYYKRRYPQDGRIKEDEPLMKSIKKIMALPDEYPAFVLINNKKVFIKAHMDEKMIFNRDEFKFIIKDYRRKINK